MIRAVLRRLPAVLGILLLVTVMPAVLVLWTRWTDWPHVTWPPLHSGFLGAVEPADLRTWAVATYHEIRLSLGTNGLLLATCLLALWITWTVMLCCLAADTLRLLRYGAHRLRANGPDGVRGWITALVTSTVLVGTASPSIASALPHSPVAASAPRHPSGAHHAPVRAVPEADGFDSGPSASGLWLRTHRGDSLWEIATIHLGDGTRWREITDLNPYLSPEPHVLRAGDWLRLPDDAVNVDPAPLPDGVRWITVADGDTLSRLAHHHLDDPDRWQEIFELNRGRTQDTDRTLRRPGFLMPGWRLAIPPTEPRNLDADGVTEGAVLGSLEWEPMSPQQPPAAVPATPEPMPPPAAPSGQDTARAPQDASGPAIMLPTSGLVATGLAAAVAVGMYLHRRGRRRTYTPGSGDRTPPAEPGPAVRALRLADDHARGSDDEPATTEPVLLPTTTDPDRTATEDGTDPATCPTAETAVQIGVRDGRAHALDLATLRGLGVTGPGAEAAVRALLVHLLATTTITVVLPRLDALALLGEEPATAPRLHITTDLSEAHATLAHRNAPAGAGCEVVLVTRLDHPDDDLADLLAADAGVAGLLLGDWPSGHTVRVRADGIVTASDPAFAELRGAQLFHLGATDTRDLLHVLTDTAPAASTDDGNDSTSTESSSPDTTLSVEATSGDPADREQQEGIPEQHEPGTGSARFTLLSDTTPARDAHDEPAAGALPQNPADSTRDDTDARTSPLQLTVFGPPTLSWHNPHGTTEDLTTVLAPKHHALLVFLALHPRGTSRDAVRDALWPDARGRRPYNAFYAALSQIRASLTAATHNQATELIHQHGEHITLNPEFVAVDYWDHAQAEHDQHRATSHQQRLTAWSRISSVYRGELAAGFSALWLDAPREAAHRTTVDALTNLAAHYRDHDPHRGLQFLEHARHLDPDNENLYRAIIRTQADLGLTDAIPRTLQLLTTALADLGLRPDPTTLTLARTLQNPPTTATIPPAQ
ncbi:LysM peptidoglycan-binding domain-containing protein [Saccharopolyspora sp. SCSIO 74807]|uniref:LysM peptidoglycan-binding domain-containing protein n=1 Tax=Saccharopolyspora sp. SCSIO 74807 TaxID=3118084 RepID=UPI0030D0782C